MKRAAILVIDDDRRMLDGLHQALAKAGYDACAAADGETGLRLLREHAVQLVISDLKMPGLDGLAVLEEVKRLGLDVEVVMLTGHGSIEAAVRAMKAGAYDFLTKPVEREHLLHLVARALERQAMLRTTRALQAAHAESRARPFIAQSPAMKRVLRIAEQVSLSDATVLIQGESGTGKELIARMIHAGSRRAAKPLIAVNCAAIPDTLLESELFGYEKGAFTGALRRKPGRFELADGGTLLLDEIAELAPATQAKLLRVLQENEIETLGGLRPLPIDVRVIAATNQDLARLVRERSFREDLYYRVNVVTIDVPPLRERPEDLVPLADYFLWLYARQMHKPVEGFGREARALLRAYPWPGNVRELQHAVHRAVILTPGAEIAAGDLGLWADAPIREGDPPSSTTTTLASMEQHWIRMALERAGGNRRAAAAALGIDRGTLYRKLRQYGVDG